MATPDHKAPASLSVPSDGALNRLSGQTHLPNPMNATQPRLSKREGIGVAVYALSRLLIESAEYQRALDDGKPVGFSSWPLPASYSEGVISAIHYLNQYAKMLGREPRVTT